MPDGKVYPTPNDGDRGNRFVRLLQMVEALRLRSMSLAELADEFQVTQRTVRRDLHVIRRAGALADIQRVHRDDGKTFSYAIKEAR